MIADDRAAALDDLQFQWVLNKTMSWSQYYDALVKYKEDHDNQDPPPTMSVRASTLRYTPISSAFLFIAGDPPGS
jgi:hypothetical protein